MHVTGKQRRHCTPTVPTMPLPPGARHKGRGLTGTKRRAEPSAPLQHTEGYCTLANTFAWKNQPTSKTCLVVTAKAMLMSRLPWARHCLIPKEKHVRQLTCWRPPVLSPNAGRNWRREKGPWVRRKVSCIGGDAGQLRDSSKGPIHLLLTNLFRRQTGKVSKITFGVTLLCFF